MRYLQKIVNDNSRDLAVADHRRRKKGQRDIVYSGLLKVSAVGDFGAF